MKIFLKQFILFLCLTAFFIVPEFVFAADYNLEKIFYISQSNAVDGVKSINDNWQKIDIVAPQMYAIQSNLTLAGGLGPKLKKSIADHNLRVMPLVVNSQFSRKIIHNLLTSSSGQDNIIAGLITLAKKNNYIGWQFDLENIDYNDKDLFSSFVEKAYAEFKKNNLILSVAAVARFVDYENTIAFKSWSGVYDYKRIANSSDFISLMVYDDPNSKGPVASVDFVNKALAYVKDKIPPEKLSLGVPLYYWKWDMNYTKKVGSGLYKNVLAIMANFRHTLGFDKDLGVAWLTYLYGKTKYAVWFENEQSFQIKLGIVKENNLRGFSAWLIGGEDPAIWKALDKS